MDALGMTQEQLAKLAEISQTAIHKLVTGKSRETRKLSQLARALRVDVNWLANDNTYNVIIHADSANFQALREMEMSNVEPRPPVIDDDFWKALSPRTRALVEDIVHKAGQGSLSDDDIKFIQDVMDKVSKK
jgi:transcriptional regulator with XRE-family HTH domain